MQCCLYRCCDGSEAYPCCMGSRRKRKTHWHSKTGFSPNRTEDFSMRISVFGLGYVGCVTAACLAKVGHDVLGVDVAPDKTAIVNEGRSPVIEPGLTELVRDMVSARRLRATVSADWAVKHSDLAMICVGTPSGANGKIDTMAIE